MSKTVYVVHSRSSRRFETLELACEYAQRYFERTGNIVAVTVSRRGHGDEVRK